MTDTEKTLLPGQVRFIPKQMGLGRGARWRVYDRARGCYPVTLPGYGSVAQTLSEEKAQTEATNLNVWFS
jgi:hypothetical protein